MATTPSSPQIQSPVSVGRGANVTGWILQIVLAAAFLGAAFAKLSGATMMVQIFDQIGFGQWFRIVTGVVEILGAVALLTPRYAVLGAIWLGITMVFAIFAHVIFLHSNPAAAIVFLLIASGIAWIRRAGLATFRNTAR